MGIVTLKRVWPLLLLGVLVAAFYASGLQHVATFANLGRQQAILRQWVRDNPAIAPIAYMAVYAGFVSLCLPAGGLLTVTGGVLFGWAAGSLFAVTGATMGAIGLFLIARTVAGDALARRAGGRMDAVRRGLQEDGFSYLLAMRLIPVVPFWLSNLAPALAGMRLGPYAAATVIGIIPATTVLASLGAGFGDALAAGDSPDLSIVFSAPVLLPLLGLAALSLTPVAWRRWRARHG